MFEIKMKHKLKKKTQNPAAAEKQQKTLPRQRKSRKPCRGRTCFSPSSCYNPGLKVLQSAALRAASWTAFLSRVVANRD